MNIIKHITNFIYKTFIEIKENIYYTQSEIYYYFYVRKRIIKRKYDDNELKQRKKCKLDIQETNTN